MYCPDCGNEVADDRQFCGKCGAVLGVDAGIHTGTTPDPVFRGQSSASSGPRKPRSLFSLIMTVLVLAAASAVLAGAAWLLWGAELDLITDPGGALVIVDGKVVGDTDMLSGALVIPHLSHGNHTVSITHPGYEEWTGTVTLNRMEMAHSLKAAMQLQAFQLTVLTNPGNSEVQVDGQGMGISDAQGSLVIPRVLWGQRIVTVKHPGYPAWSKTVLVSAATPIQADLVAAALELQNIRDQQASVLYQRLAVTVQQVRFFEGPIEVPALQDRRFAARFPSRETRYVWWQLDLASSAQSARRDFTIVSVWYGPDGQELTRQPIATYIDAYWTDAHPAQGWGSQSGNSLRPGSYRVELFFEGTRVAVGSFEIYQD
jgi:hypothetical protein